MGSGYYITADGMDGCRWIMGSCSGAGAGALQVTRGRRDLGTEAWSDVDGDRGVDWKEGGAAR